ncbi:MAG: RICIN domain-containing protein, partial [Planctomycetota bacterium]|nr:RICIN domain-containing protein [Planctomycetota bacterium]
MRHGLISGRIPTSLALLAAGLTSSAAAWAEDWGAYAIVPSSAPAFVLEAVGAGTTDGGVVSIGKPAGGANQKWVVTPQADGLCAIRPLSSPTLALAIAHGKDAQGTLAVLEADRGRPWQRWRLVKNNDDGSYCLLPAHAAGQGLDHFGGVAKPGARVDLWSNRPGDTHLRWVMKPLAGTSPPSVAAESGPVAYVPPEIKPEDVPRGVLKEFNFTRSAVFPGTVRAVTVFIPKQYDGSRPACVYVKTDGYNATEKALLETMIATKEIPVTVGVFVRPGDLPATVKGTSGRRNRCFEYDGVGDNNVRFLVDELLPYIAREYDLKLSRSGNDRCIAGGSSGGITAFNAAWERPDAFSRVYAVSGSFVAFRGGHEFPTLVRKFEAKPIRAYLTTGTHDMENCAGDWFLLDQEMDKALKFSGYDYVFQIINGGHGAGYFDHFRAAMSYLWKDWPRPVEAGASAPRVRDVILPGEPWRLVDDAPRDAKAPVCNAQGDVFFVNAAADAVERIGRDGKISTFVPDAGRA